MKRHLVFVVRSALLLILLVGILVFSTALVACNGADKAAAGKPGGPGGAAMGPAKLPAIVLGASSAQASIAVPGTVLAEQEVQIQAEIAGKVTEIGFREGEPVRAGQILVRLDESELKAQWQGAEAALLLAKSRNRSVQEDYKSQAVSRNEFDAAEAELKTAAAAAALAKARLDKSRIMAPFAGVAGLRGVDMGTMLHAGTPVTTVQDLRSFRVEFSVPENQAAFVKQGLKVRFTVAGREDTLTAAVFAVDPGVDPGTRLLRARARLVPPPGGLRPGAYARVELPLRESNALWVPAQSVVGSARGAEVWRIRGGVAELAVFQAGTRTPESVEAVQGLSAGDTILISGLMQVKPGIPVQPVLVR
jgi:membrane fusion protein (multidrug efflux system)